MKKRRAKKKRVTLEENLSYPNEEKQFVDLIARMIVDITLEQAKYQNKKNDK